MQIGNKVKISECHKFPELVGQEAEVIAMASQELSPYPVVVKITSGEHAGKFCGFRPDELSEVGETPDGPAGNGTQGIPPAFLK